ncbi:MAG: sulfurtransferase TusA family protein [Planctomycetota bacterium]
MPKHRLDCRGLNCPMPIVRISQAMNGLEAGEVLQVQADDPAFRDDIEAWAQMTGNQLLSIEEGEITTADLKRRL